MCRLHSQGLILMSFSQTSSNFQSACVSGFAERCQWVRSQHPDFFGKIGDHPHEFLSFGRGYPFQVQTPLKAHKCEQFLDKGDPFNGHVITRLVMAVADMSPAHQNTVGTILQAP